MKPFVRSALLALVLCSGPVLAKPPEPPTATKADETLNLRPGGTKTLTIPNVTRLALGDPDYADVSIQGSNEIRVEGKKAGETTLVIWSGEKSRKVYRIVVK